VRDAEWGRNRVKELDVEREASGDCDDVVEGDVDDNEGDKSVQT
jgi:hypothetical protein